MKLKLDPEAQDALQNIRFNADSRNVLRALGDAILADKFRRPLLESNVEQFSDLGARRVAHAKAVLDGAQSFLRQLMAELTPKPGEKLGEEETE